MNKIGMMLALGKRTNNSTQRANKTKNTQRTHKEQKKNTQSAHKEHTLTIPTNHHVIVKHDKHFGQIGDLVEETFHRLGIKRRLVLHGHNGALRHHDQAWVCLFQINRKIIPTHDQINHPFEPGHVLFNRTQSVQQFPGFAHTVQPPRRRTAMRSLRE